MSLPIRARISRWLFLIRFMTSPESPPAPCAHGQHGLVFAQQMLVELRLENFPASLRLRTYRAIRRPEAENDAGNCRVEQRHPEAIFLPAQFFREVTKFARMRELPGPSCRRLFGSAHTCFHSAHRPAASTSDMSLELAERAYFSGSEYGGAQCFCGFDEIPVQGGERQFAAQREF
jgi:hypothetical protein